MQFVSMYREFCALKSHVLSQIKKDIHKTMAFTKSTSLDMNVSDETQWFDENDMEFR